MVQVRGSGRTGQFITGSFRLEKVKTYMRHPKEEESHLRAPQLKPLKKIECCDVRTISGGPELIPHDAERSFFFRTLIRVIAVV